ncbi:MAG TPA: AAA family ATPase [Candidatus Tectomicrobia bacterium]|nr:AAA family ATPase [Candidatus Tectomicrobia bacterium]
MALSPMVEFAPFRLDVRDERLWRGQEARPLTPKAFAVLRCLVAHPGQLVTKAMLMDTVWPETAISESTLTGCIWEVRQALGDSARHPHYLETVHGRGYRFIAPVTEPAAPAAQPPAAGELAPGAPVPAQPVACLVGREAELAHLAQWYERARQGQRQVGLIGGEPGIGKSALVETFVAQVAAKAPVWIAHGQCIEQYGAGEPYLPLLEALGRLCRGPGGDGIVAVLHQVAPSWLVHLPAVVSAADREALARLASGGTPARMMRELTEALEVVTATRPVVLVLEDLHWSDPPTLEWLHYVARRRDPARLLVVGTYRSVEVIVRKHPLQRVRAELRQLPQGQELVLDYLSEAAVAAYLTHRFGALPQSARVARLLHQRTNGNPLFLLAVVDELIRRHILHQTDEAWGVSGSVEAVAEIIPESLHILLEQHVEQLSPDDQRLLEAASVAGVEFTAAAVAAGLAHADERVEARCTALAQQGRVLQASGRAEWPDGTVTAGYRFRHALYQELVYRRLPAGRQTRWHARIGARLAQGFGAQAGDLVAVLAMHCVRGRLLPQAVQYLRQAGTRAHDRAAFREAVAFFDEALQALARLPKPGDTRGLALDLRLALGDALNALGEYERRLALLNEAAALARALDDRSRLARVFVQIAHVRRIMGDTDGAMAAGRQAFELAAALGDSAVQVEVFHRLGQVYYAIGDFGRTVELLRWNVEAADRASSTLSTDVRIQSQAWLGGILCWLGAFAEGRRHGQEALRLATLVGRGVTPIIAHGCLGHGYLTQGDLEPAIQVLEQGLTLCRASGILDWLRPTMANLGSAYALQGRLAEGRALLEEAISVAIHVGGRQRPLWVAWLSEVCRLAGRGEEAWQHARRALDLARQLKDRGDEAVALHQLGAVHAHADRPDVAQAEAHYQQALALAEELGMRPLVAHCHQGLGTLYAATDQREQAQTALSTAIELYRAMDMAFWLPETEAALAQVAERSS